MGRRPGDFRDVYRQNNSVAGNATLFNSYFCQCTATLTLKRRPQCPEDVLVLDRPDAKIYFVLRTSSSWTEPNVLNVLRCSDRNQEVESPRKLHRRHPHTPQPSSSNPGQQLTTRKEREWERERERKGESIAPVQPHRAEAGKRERDIYFTSVPASLAD